MNRDQALEFLRSVKTGEISPEEGLSLLEKLPGKDLGFARPDFHRSLRTGFGEVIFGLGKSASEILMILSSFAQEKMLPVLVTKCSPEKGRFLEEHLTQGRYFEEGRIFVLGEFPEQRIPGLLILSAGTSDREIAKEAELTAKFYGLAPVVHQDVGVAGIHRLFALEDDLRQAKIIIVVAGMEGALLSVVGGLSPVPVIGVPTSVGYGSAFQGITPLLGMLNSCASGTVAVNIDNGFGAAYFAALTLKVFS